MKKIPSQVKIGTKKTSSKIIAHAWVEVQGKAIGEPDYLNDSFTVFKQVDSKSALLPGYQNTNNLIRLGNENVNG